MLPNLVRSSCLWKISLGKSHSEIDLSGPIIFFHFDWRKKIFQVFQIYLEPGGYEDLAWEFSQSEMIDMLKG